MKLNRTRKIKLGKMYVGGDAPISIQSMTNTPTTNTTSTLEQVSKLKGLGCDIVRVSVPDKTAVDSFMEIRSKVDIPMVADIHFNSDIALECINRGCEAIRINPGNIGGKDEVERIVLASKEKGACVRIGVNSGSLEKDLLKKYGGPSPEALAESALNWSQFFERLDFYNFKLSVKSSSPELMVIANQILSTKTKAPLHIGLTESGTLVSGMVKSSIALSKLLEQGIGDTVRVSLSSDPSYEVMAAKAILKTLGLARGIDIISCPTCSRTNMDVIKIAESLEREFSSEKINIKVAVMGCVVNGPGEAKEADAGIAGSSNDAVFFINGKIMKRVKLNDAYEELKKYIKGKIMEAENKNG